MGSTASTAAVHRLQREQVRSPLPQSGAVAGPLRHSTLRGRQSLHRRRCSSRVVPVAVRRRPGPSLAVPAGLLHQLPSFRRRPGPSLVVPAVCRTSCRRFAAGRAHRWRYRQAAAPVAVVSPAAGPSLAVPAGCCTSCRRFAGGRAHRWRYRQSAAPVAARRAHRWRYRQAAAPVAVISPPAGPIAGVAGRLLHQCRRFAGDVADAPGAVPSAAGPRPRRTTAALSAARRRGHQVKISQKRYTRYTARAAIISLKCQGARSSSATDSAASLSWASRPHDRSSGRCRPGSSTTVPSTWRTAHTTARRGSSRCRSRVKSRAPDGARIARVVPASSERRRTRARAALTRTRRRPGSSARGSGRTSGAARGWRTG